MLLTSYIIKHVTGLIFKKDGEHHSYQIKQWSHQKCIEAVRSVLKPQRCQSAIVVSSHESPSSVAVKKDKGGKKIRSMLRDVFAFCKYNATQIYELRKDVNKLLLKVDLLESHLLPSPILSFRTRHPARMTLARLTLVTMSLSVLSYAALGVPRLPQGRLSALQPSPMVKMMLLLRMKTLHKRRKQRTPGAASDGFETGKADSTLFIQRNGNDIFVCQIYVDDCKCNQAPKWVLVMLTTQLKI
jgi:hypothetical protein